MNKTVATETLSVLRFEMMGTLNCIDLQYLAKVLLLPLLNPVPNSAPHLAGLMNSGGHSIPVIDLALRLNMHRTEKYTLETPVLLCAMDHQQIGLIVDKVYGLATLTVADIEMREEFKTKDALMSGTVILDGKLTYIINFENILLTDKAWNDYQPNNSPDDI